MKRLIATLFSLLLSTAAYASGNAVLIPAAGHIDGGGGVTFRSDIAIHNLRAVRQFVRLDWLPRSGSGQVRSSTTRLIPANTAMQSDDFVSGVLSTEGLGAVIVQPVNEDGTTDDLAAKLLVTSRIWSPAPGHDLSTPGNVSQSFPPLTLGSIVNTKVAIAGVRQDNYHRLNVGVVNMDSVSPQTFRIWTEDIVNSPVIELTVDAYSMQQISLPPTFTTGRTRVMVEIVPASGGRLSLWTAYASVVDNVTGDSWTSIGVNVTE